MTGSDQHVINRRFFDDWFMKKNEVLMNLPVDQSADLSAGALCEGGSKHSTVPPILLTPNEGGKANLSGGGLWRRAL